MGHNLEDADTCGFDDPTDLIDTDPNLEDLAQNAPEDPPTRTHALPADSPAVDHYGSGGACDVAVDQREVARPQDGDDDGGAACDIGAFELQGEPEADVAVDKTAPGSASVGDQFDYEVEVTNNGPDTAEDVELTENLLSQVSFVSVDPSGDCAETSTDVVECNQADVTISKEDFECVPENTVDPLPEGVSRLSGPERIATAIEISRESCPDGDANAVGRSTTRSRREVVTT